MTPTTEDDAWEEFAWEGGLPPSSLLPIPNDRVEWARDVARQSGVVDELIRWHGLEPRGRGGRKPLFPYFEPIVVALALAARHSLSFNLTAAQAILFVQISPSMRAALGLPEPPADDDRDGWKRIYKNVEDRFHAMAALMDPSDEPKNRRRNPAQYETARNRKQAGKARATTADERYGRLAWFMNALQETALRHLPRDVRRAWNGSVCVDATPVKAFARGNRPDTKNNQVATYSADPDAGWYVRSSDKRDEKFDNFKASKTQWAFEVPFVVMASDSPTRDDLFPKLTIGLAPLHKPAIEPGENALVALTSIHHRGHPARRLAGDRAYSSSKPHKYQLPARALGYEHVFDYRVDQLGEQSSYNGFHQVDGGWYCPEMPKSLVNAGLDFRQGRIDEDEYGHRVAARQAYETRWKEKPDAEGHQRVMCPAAGPYATVRCANKPSSETEATRGKPRIQLTDATIHNTPRCCTQQSVTMPPTAGAKFQQPLRHGSKEWHEAYSVMRNTIEGFNGFVKDSSKEALGESQRRRVRGVAAQSIFTAFAVFGANIRAVESFLKKAVRQSDGTLKKPRARSRRRQTASITDWLPDLLENVRGPT